MAGVEGIEDGEELNHPVVEGFGPLDARLLLLGERPGREEMAQRRPFVGATGEMVEEALGGWSGVRRTNVRCYLDERESRERAAEGYRECHSHLETEIVSLVHPRTLLALGSDAASFAVGRADISKLHGSTFTRKEAEAMRGSPLPPSLHSIVISFHPAYAMRGMPQQMPWIRKAIGWARTLSERESFERPRFEMIIQPSAAEFQAYVDRNRDPIAIDIETPKDRHSQITMVGVSGAPYSACVSAWHDGIAKVMAGVLRDSGRVKIAHNGGFDWLAFMKNGLTVVEPCADTIQMEALLCPPFKEARKRRWLSLSTCIARRVEGWAYHKEPDDPMTRLLYKEWFPEIPEWRYPFLYNSLDVAGDRLLYESQVSALRAVEMF